MRFGVSGGEHAALDDELAVLHAHVSRLRAETAAAAGVDAAAGSPAGIGADEGLRRHPAQCGCRPASRAWPSVDRTGMTTQVEMIRLPSRAVAEAGYDAASRALRIRFRHGGLYAYLDVPKDVFDGLLAAPHPWTAWGTHIKASYRVHRLE